MGEAEGVIVLLVLVLAVLGIAAIWALAAWAGRIARRKGRNPTGWVIATILLGLIQVWPALLVVLTLHLLPGHGEQPIISIGGLGENLKTCPQCAEKVKAAAKVCRYCSYEFKDLA